MEHFVMTIILKEAAGKLKETIPPRRSQPRLEIVHSQSD
jgi:hypothetical protein